MSGLRVFDCYRRLSTANPCLITIFFIAVLASGACTPTAVQDARRAAGTLMKDSNHAIFGEIFEGRKKRMCGSVTGENIQDGGTNVRRFIVVGSTQAMLEPMVGDPLGEMFQKDWITYCRNAVNPSPPTV